MLQFSAIDTESDLGIAGIVFAGIFGCMELFLIIIYIIKAFADINWMNESDNIKYRSLFDRIY